MAISSNIETTDQQWIDLIERRFEATDDEFLAHVIEHDLTERLDAGTAKQFAALLQEVAPSDQLKWMIKLDHFEGVGARVIPSGTDRLIFDLMRAKGQHAKKLIRSETKSYTRSLVDPFVNLIRAETTGAEDVATLITDLRRRTEDG